MASSKGPSLNFMPTHETLRLNTVLSNTVYGK